MRKLILFLAVVLITTLQIKGQPVSSMPTFTGNTSGAYIPIIIPVSSTFSNRKYPMDSLAYLKTIRDTSAVLRALIGSGGGSYTASQGLTLSSSDLQLGGTIASDRTINTSTFNVGFQKASDNYLKLYGGKIEIKKPVQNTITDNYLEVLPLTSAASQLKWNEFRHWSDNGGGLDSNEVIFKGFNINKGGGAEVGGAPVWGSAWESNYRIPGRILEHYVIHQNSAGQYSRPQFYYMPEDKNLGEVYNQINKFYMTSPTDASNHWGGFFRNYNGTAARYLPSMAVMQPESGLLLGAGDNNTDYYIGNLTANYGDLIFKDYKIARFTDRVSIEDTLTIAASAGSGKVLTSDASGNATWQTPAAGGVTATSGTAGQVGYFTGTNNLKGASLSTINIDTTSNKVTFGSSTTGLSTLNVYSAAGGYTSGIDIESGNNNSYAVLRFKGNGGSIMGYMLSAGTSFTNGITTSSALTLSNVRSGGNIILSAEGGGSNAILFAVGGGAASDERMKIDNSGRVGIGTQAGGIATSAALDITSTTRGLLLPRMTKAQRDAISSPVAGLAVYQTDNTPGLRVYNGTNWMRYTETTD